LIVKIEGFGVWIVPSWYKCHTANQTLNIGSIEKWVDGLEITMFKEKY